MCVGVVGEKSWYISDLECFIDTLKESWGSKKAFLRPQLNTFNLARNFA